MSKTFSTSYHGSSSVTQCFPEQNHLKKKKENKGENASHLFCGHTWLALRRSTRFATNSRTLKIMPVLSCPELLGCESRRNYGLLMTFPNCGHFCHLTHSLQTGSGNTDTLHQAMQMWRNKKSHSPSHMIENDSSWKTSQAEKITRPERRTLQNGMWNKAPYQCGAATV